MTKKPRLQKRSVRGHIEPVEIFAMASHTHRHFVWLSTCQAQSDGNNRNWSVINGKQMVKHKFFILFQNHLHPTIPETFF
jgi:hypothetical protein